MAPPTPTASPNNTPNATAAPRVPPDEQFWQRYSPHHEFPLSGVTSAALHVLVVALLLLAAWVAYRLGWGQEKEPLPVTAVRVEGGGGGNRQGVGDAPGKGDTAAPVEDRQVPPTDTPRPQPQVKLNNLDPGKADPLVPKVRDDHGQNDVKPIQDATKTLQGIQKDAL
ncbi:MAG TPA: hypothetical protein VJ739_00605, partial [Gemmataceae bacterium]|nr:hypothetical protein [Gemmataceae bacterium]